MAQYGSGNDETVITEYLDSHLEGGIKQANLDKVLDLIDDYIEIKESVLTDAEMNDKQVTVTIVGNSEDTAVNLIHKVMNGKYDERNNKRDSKKTK